MNCEKVDELLNEFHDGATSAPLQSQIERHIGGCPSCAAALNRLQDLRSLLQKDIAPLPSSSLEQKLMRAFLERHAPPKTKAPAWRYRLFAGSVSIPKPIFAAALMAIALALTTANLLGRRAAVTTAVDTASTAPSSASLQSPLPAEAFERTKIVEVPVVKECVITKIVTKTVYVERENANINKIPKKPSAFDSSRTTAVSKERDNADNFAVPNLPMSGSVAENGYYTQTDLSGFEPAAESNLRIIRKEKSNEK